MDEPEGLFRNFNQKIKDLCGARICEWGVNTNDGCVERALGARAKVKNENESADIH